MSMVHGLSIVRLFLWTLHGSKRKARTRRQHRRPPPPHSKMTLATSRIRSTVATKYVQSGTGAVAVAEAGTGIYERLYRPSILISKQKLLLQVSVQWRLGFKPNFFLNFLFSYTYLIFFTDVGRPLYPVNQQVSTVVTKPTAIVVEVVGVLVTHFCLSCMLLVFLSIVFYHSYKLVQ